MEGVWCSERFFKGKEDAKIGRQRWVDDGPLWRATAAEGSSNARRERKISCSGGSSAVVAADRPVWGKVEADL